MPVVDWPAPAGVRAGYTTRCGGVSAEPFDAFNLGDHVGDAPAAVAQNRLHLARQMGCRPVFLQQVHGTAVARIDAQTPDGLCADASFSTTPGVACAVLVADCLPILLARTDGLAVAAAHAGWRGLAGQGGVGIVESVLASFRAIEHMNKAQGTSEIIAWLGPCIGPQAFEVGADVVQAFGPHAHACFVPGRRAGRWWADLPALARLRLAAGGVARVYGNDGSAAWCTWTQASDFFSYRRDGVCGRQAAWVAIEPGANQAPR